MQDATTNKKLDAEIARFLLLATPYFLLNACHKALEWLVFRYCIHQYNRDEFILLILPYHETRIFVRYVLLKHIILLLLYICYCNCMFSHEIWITDMNYHLISLYSFTHNLLQSTFYKTGNTWNED